ARRRSSPTSSLPATGRPRGCPPAWRARSVRAMRPPRRSLNRPARPPARRLEGIILNDATPLRDLAPEIRLDELEGKIAHATEGLLGYRKADGHFCFELEADATIPAEYVLMRHFRGEPIDHEIEQKIAVYLRRIQGEHNGWPLF